MTQNASVIKYVLEMEGGVFPWDDCVNLLVRELDELTLAVAQDSDGGQSTNVNPFDKYHFLFQETKNKLPIKYFVSAVCTRSEWGWLFIHYAYRRGQMVFLERELRSGMPEYGNSRDAFSPVATLLIKALRTHYRNQNWASLLSSFVNVNLVTCDWMWRYTKEEKALKWKKEPSFFDDFFNDCKKCNSVAPGNIGIPFTALSVASFLQKEGSYMLWWDDRLCKADPRYTNIEHLKEDKGYDREFKHFIQYMKENHSDRWQRKEAT